MPPYDKRQDPFDDDDELDEANDLDLSDVDDDDELLEEEEALDDLDDDFDEEC